MKREHDCSAKVYNPRGDSYYCQKEVRVERDGKWYCTVHDPEYIRMKQERWNDKFNKEWVERSKEQDLINARRIATQGLTLEELRQTTPALIREALTHKS